MSAKYFPKKFFTLLLFIVFMFGLIPAAEADATNYNLWVGGTRVTNENCNNNNNNWSYDANANKLTLNGFTYTGDCTAGTSNNIHAGIYYNGSTELTIELTGTNTITMNAINAETTNSYGIHTNTAKLKISGEGSLTVTGGNIQQSARSYGIYSDGDITVISGTLTAKGGNATQTNQTTNSYGIWCKTITVKGGTVKATGGNASYSYGICDASTNMMTVEGGTVEAEGGTASDQSYGIKFGKIEVKGGTIKAKGGNATQNDSSYGIDCSYGTMTVSGGTVTATGGEGKANSYGIHCYNTSMALTGGIITATGGTTTDTDGASYGIDCNNNITVNGATVTATGGKAGIHCYNGTITVTNGEVTATATKIEGNEIYGIHCAEQKLASVRLSSTGGSFTINGGKLTASGASQAIKSSSFSTSIAGTGWTDTAGTAGKAPIPAGTMNISSYKKIVFQAQQSSTPGNPADNNTGGGQSTGYEVIDTDTGSSTQTTTTDVTLKGDLTGKDITEVIQDIETKTEVKTLDLSNVTGVTEVKLPENTKIETLTITGNTSIKKVEITQNNSLKSINLSGSKIKEVNASECSVLETVEVENNEALVTLNVSYSSVTTLNARNCINLANLNCERCEITELDLEGCEKLSDLDCSYNSLTRLDVSTFTNLASLASHGQRVTNVKRVRSFNLIDFLFRRIANFFLSDYSEEDLLELEKVQDLKAFDEYDNEIQVSSDDQGNLTFSNAPATIKYNYSTGFNNNIMDVTVVTVESENEEEDGDGDDVNVADRNCGGCNSNFGFAALAVLLKFCSCNNLQKSRKRT